MELEQTEIYGTKRIQIGINYKGFEAYCKFWLL